MVARNAPRSRSHQAARRDDDEPRRCRIRVSIPFELGVCIRARRHQLKLGQADLAARVGVGRQWVIACESGKGSVEVALVLKAFAVLGLDLFVVDGDPPAWTIPLTQAAGTAARPYAKRRHWRNHANLPKG